MNKSPGQPAQIFSLQFPCPKIVFLYGFPGCGLKLQADRLRTEFGYVHLDMKTLMTQEVKRGSQEGQALQKTLEAGLIPSSVLRVNLLIRAFSLQPAASYVITGFLKNLSEALEFEREICGIKIIASFTVTDWQEFFHKHESHQKREKIESFIADKHEVIEFYKKLNIVREVDAVGVVEKVFKRFKQAIQPEVFFIIGVPGCGKSTIAKKMADKYNLVYIDVETLAWEKNINNQMKKLTDNDAITKKVIVSMEQMSAMRFLIEGFPMNLYQLQAFERAFGAPKKLFYLALYKEELILRCKRPKIGLEYFEYVKNAGSMLDYIEPKQYFSRINANLTVEKTFEQISKEIEPEVVLIANDYNNQIKDYLIKQGYQYFNLHESMKSVCSRLTEKGKEIIRLTEAGKIIPGKLFISIIQETVYSGCTFGKKFAIGGTYPGKVKELEFLEKNCVKISRLYNFVGHEDLQVVPYIEEESLQTHMFRENKFVRLNESENFYEDFKNELEKRIDRKSGKYILFLGATLTGKSALAKKFSQKTGFKVVNYEEIPDIVKAKKSTEDEPYEKVSFLDILEEIKLMLQNRETTLILDGIPPENLVLSELEVTADDEEVKDRTHEYLHEVYEKLLAVLGMPYMVFHLTCDIKHLKHRLFKRLELGPEDELNDDQIDPLNKSIKSDHSLSSKFLMLNISYPPSSINSIKKRLYYEVNTNLSEDRSLSYILSAYSPKLILIEETIQSGISTSINNICLNHDIAHINIPKLLMKESELTTERGETIANLLKQKVSIPANLIISLIKDELKRLPIGDQLVVLSEFLNNRDPYQYPRIMDMFVSIEESLGEIVGVIVVTPRIRRRQVDADNIPVVHYPPPKKEGDENKAEENEEGEEIKEKPPEVVLPSRSEPRNPINLPKMFQLYKRNIPKFENWDDEAQLDDAVMRGFDYVAYGKYLSLDDHERLSCPNIQILN